MTSSQRSINFLTPSVFVPLVGPSRHKGAHGGRGSGKSHFFAEHLLEYAMAEPGISGQGLFAACIRQVQKSLRDSAKRLIENKMVQLGIGQADGFRVYHDRIATPKDGAIIFEGMKDHTADSIKSLEGAKIAWWEEAQSAQKYSISILTPTMRTEGSELWWSWNPRRPGDAIEEMLRSEDMPTNSTVVEANWRDNPMFPPILEQERLDCLRLQPEQYDHIWEGGYATVLEGAYYAKELNKARIEGRILKLGPEPLIRKRAFIDIGGRGEKSDAFTIWVAQFVSKQIYILDYYETVGQVAETHIRWLRENGYSDALVYLPHDGKPKNAIYDASWETRFRDAGFEVIVVPNQGVGAALQRVHKSREYFDRMLFDEEKTEYGRQALGWYHAKVDSERGIDLGPHHDWSSNGADSFGMISICYEDPMTYKPARKRRNFGGGFGWLS